MEGFLLLTCYSTNTLHLFNLLTQATYILPDVENISVPMDNGLVSFTTVGIVFDTESPGRPTVLFAMTSHNSAVILYAKPNDDCCGIVDIGDLDDVPKENVLIDNVRNIHEARPPPFTGGMSLKGQFYIATCQGSVLKVELAPRPHLV